MDQQVARSYQSNVASGLNEFNSYINSKSRSEIGNKLGTSIGGLSDPQKKLQGQISGLINEGVSALGIEGGVKFANENILKPVGNYARSYGENASAQADRLQGQKDALQEVIDGYKGEGNAEANTSSSAVAENSEEFSAGRGARTDFTGDTSGVEGVSGRGDIRVSSDVTRPDPAQEPVAEPSVEPSVEPSGDITSQLPVEGLGETASGTAAPPPPPRSLYTSDSQLGLSEEGYAARQATFAQQFSQAPQKVMFDNTQDPPLSDIMDRMQRGDLTLGDSPAEAISQEQAGGRLSQLLDTQAEQRATTSFGYGGTAEREAVAQGAPSVDVGAGTRAITQTELARPPPPPPTDQPLSQPEADTREVFNPEGAQQETTQLAESHRPLIQEAGSEEQSVAQAGGNLEKTQLEGQLGSLESEEVGSGLLGAIGEGAGAVLGGIGAIADFSMPLVGLGLGIAGLADAASDAKKAAQQQANNARERMSIENNTAFDEAMVSSRGQSGTQALMANLDTSKFQSSTYAHF